MIRAGVAGHPIRHSLSPTIHTRWLHQRGVEGTYEAFDPGGTAEDFARLVARLRAAGFAGLNVTMPFKPAALALADEADAAARRIGGANTLTFGAGGVHAANTDALGFAAALRAHGVRPRRALVLGAGGTAPAVLAALDGTADVAVTNRTETKAHALAERFGRRALPWPDRHAAAREADLIVHATPLGLEEGDPLPLDLDGLSRAAVVADCVYAPDETPLVRVARARGLPAFDGLFMLVAQAAPGHEAWFGSRIDDALIAQTVAAVRGRTS